MNKDLIAAGLVLLFLLSRKRQPVMAAPTMAAQQTRNVNSDMWGQLLGSTWTSMLKNGALNGTVATNSAGQIVSGNGVPVAADTMMQDSAGYNANGSYYGDYGDAGNAGSIDMFGGSNLDENAWLA